MPRMSEAEKQRSHGRIVDAAARMFRERGIESTSVADVMKAAGMTHGGFYRHFASKEELVAAAFRHAVDDVVSEIENADTPADRSARIDTYIAQYLSRPHVDAWSSGCPLASMGVELARMGGTMLREGGAAADRMAGLLPQAEPETDASNKAHGLALMALMMGTLQLARLAQSKNDADDALAAGRAGIALLQKHWPAD